MMHRNANISLWLCGLFALSLAGLVALLAGCHSAKPKTKAPAPPPPVVVVATNAPVKPKPVIAWAEIVYVNAAQGYVAMRSKGLQFAAGEATVWRGTNEVARLRVGGPARPAWLTADILSGHPRPGDRVEIVITNNQNSESGGR